MKKMLVMIMGLVLTMSLCACGTDHAPEPKLSNPNGEILVEEILVEEILVEEIKVEEIKVQEIKIKGIME